MIRQIIAGTAAISIALIASVSLAQSEPTLLTQAMQADVGSTGAEGFSFENDTVTSLRAEERSYLVLPEPYDNFELSVEYWIEADTNSGVYVRCQDANAISASSCYEANIWDENENPDNKTGSIVNFAPPLVAINSLEEWNSMTIRADGNRIIVSVNGQTTAELTDDTYSTGHVALQYGGENGLVKFRNVMIEEL